MTQVGYLYETLIDHPGDWLYDYFHSDSAFTDDPTAGKRNDLLTAMQARLAYDVAQHHEAARRRTPLRSRFRWRFSTHFDSTQDAGFSVAYRVGDSAGPNVLVDIVRGPMGVKLTWFNFHMGAPSPAPLTSGTCGRFSAPLSLTPPPTRSSPRLLTPAEWRALGENPTGPILARYEAKTLDIEDEVVVDMYCGLVYQMAMARLDDNERQIGALLADQAQVDRRTAYAETLKEASTIRDALEARLVNAKRT